MQPPRTLRGMRTFGIVPPTQSRRFNPLYPFGLEAAALTR